jgi:chemotaxis signal transduction protein
MQNVSLISFNNKYFKYINVITIKAAIAYGYINVPEANKYITGLINFEGEIIPLINFTDFSIRDYNIKIVVLNSENGIFAVPGVLVPDNIATNDVTEINYIEYFSNG